MTTPEVSESTRAVRSASIAEVVARWTATGPVRASTTLTGVGAGSSAAAAVLAGLASVLPAALGTTTSAPNAVAPRIPATARTIRLFRFMAFSNGPGRPPVPSCCQYSRPARG